MEIKKLLIQLDHNRDHYKKVMEEEEKIINNIYANYTHGNLKLHKRCFKESEFLYNNLQTTIQTILLYVGVEDQPD